MQYDVRGNMISKSMPYIAGEDVNNYYYVYDNQNRLVEEIWPNGLVKNYHYNGLQTTVNTVSPQGVCQVEVETYNPMGWRIQTIDIGGNIIDYEYYSDGNLKNTLIGGNPKTKVSYEYDNKDFPTQRTVTYSYYAINNTTWDSSLFTYTRTEKYYYNK